MSLIKEKDLGIIVEPGEYSVQTLLEELRKNFQTKVNGKPFTSNDVYQYIMKKNIPFEYGGNVLVISHEGYNKTKIQVTGKRRKHGK